jgi:enoyl-CoA hydratase/carnithine racemase
VSLGHTQSARRSRVIAYRAGVRTVSTLSEQVLAHVVDRVGWITLNRPEKRNAISDEMFAALSALADEWGRDDEVRVVVVRGAGEQAFASGADMGELDHSTAGSPPSGARKGFTLQIPKPLIAMVHGFCIGGGLMVAMEADLRIAADDAVFAIPAGPLGAGYPLLGVQRLVSLVGPSHAASIMFTGDRFDARRALELGLVNEVVPRAQLEERVVALAGRIAENAPLSLAAAKAVIEATIGTPGATFGDAQALIDACWVSDDFREGRRAFTEKRRPEFRGR